MFHQRQVPTSGTDLAFDRSTQDQVQSISLLLMYKTNFRQTHVLLPWINTHVVMHTVCANIT